MEIALLTKSGIRIKSKQAAIAIDPQDKGTYEAVLVMSKSVEEVTQPEDAVLILGVGEFEIGGVKITGIRSENDMLFSLIIDGVEVLVGKLQALEKMQHKLKEHQIVVVNCDTEGVASFITSLAENVVVFYGEQAVAVSASFGKENVKTLPKYSSTKDKLPAEVETILLQ
jgi:hypothetical protein